MHFLERRNSPRHILESRFVRLVIRNMNNLRLRTRHFSDLPSEITDADLLGVAEIEYFTVRAVSFHQRNECANDVTHVTKAAALLSISVDGNRLTSERLANERRNDHAVVARLPRTHCIEQTPN